jgi:hypothetical protein
LRSLRTFAACSRANQSGALREFVRTLPPPRR